MASANANLAARIGTAIVMVPALLAMLYLLPPIYFYSFLCLATAVGALEFFRMTHPGDAVAQWLGAAATVGVSLTLYFLADEPRALLAAFLLLPAFAMAVTLARLGAIETAALRLVALAFGPAYVGCMTLLARLLRERGGEGPGFVVMTLMIAWFADTAGYFAGRFLGRRKLYERVSPKKTIAGAVGGLGGSVVGVLFAKFVYLPGIRLEQVLPLAVVASALGQMGDLGESLIKRSTGVKDSGGIVPGHGGVLDRIDALLVVAPIVYLYTRVAYG
ncbi:MAG TPA: phosphatidate cytidylyltransferase [Polyangiaceae bacterium]|nr:phosphatidate cytidylyltransferase [Polyangiaceae bacterium]